MMQPKMKMATKRRMTTAAASGKAERMVSFMLTKVGELSAMRIRRNWRNEPRPRLV